MRTLNLRAPIRSPVGCTIGVHIPEPVSARAYEITAYEVYHEMRINPIHNAVLESHAFGDRLGVVREIRDRYNAEACER